MEEGEGRGGGERMERKGKKGGEGRGGERRKGRGRGDSPLQSQFSIGAAGSRYGGCFPM